MIMLMKMDMNKLIDRYLKTKTITSLDNCQEVMELYFLLNKQNTQFYLAWADAINKISTVW